MANRAVPGGGGSPEGRAQEPKMGYVGALDGLRALAVLGVMAYHGGISWLGGGFLGVDAFFVLSGFLITSLLVAEWQRTRTILLRAFWARRARRLLPALLLMIVFVLVYARFVVAPGTYPDLRLDALSTLLYVANWHFILVGANYFVQTGLPSPLTHTWSLAIEEQFYVIWPLVVLGVLAVTRRLGVLLGVCLAGMAGSATEMALLYHPGGNTTRLYYGTDTHAQSLLAGAALAVVLAMVAARRAGGPAGRSGGGDPRWVARSREGRLACGTAGIAGVALGGVLWSQVNGSEAVLYQGGFLVAALATTGVLVAVVGAPGSVVERVLSWSPLRYLGRISYGMYLWHYPLFIWLDGARTQLSGYGLFGLRAGATVVVATASYYLVERPIRQGTFFRSWRGWVGVPAAGGLTVAAVILATAVPAVPAVAAPAPVKAHPAGSGSLYSGPPVRVLVEGDSTALTLGLGMSEDVKSYDVVEKDEGILGCGVTSGSQVELQGKDYPTADGCDNNPHNVQWPQLWTDWLNVFHPNVVVILAGRWEVVNRTWKGQWTNITNPAFAAYVKSRLNYAVQVASAQGARVALLTAPCYESGEQPNGQPWPEDSPQRVAAYNHLVDQVAAANPTVVTLVHFHSMVCPGGHYEASIGGVQIRRSDGVHFTIAGGLALAPKLWPTIVRIGREQMAAARSHS